MTAAHVIQPQVVLRDKATTIPDHGHNTRRSITRDMARLDFFQRARFLSASPQYQARLGSTFTGAGVDSPGRAYAPQALACRRPCLSCAARGRQQSRNEYHGRMASEPVEVDKAPASFVAVCVGPAMDEWMAQACVPGSNGWNA